MDVATSSSRVGAGTSLVNDGALKAAPPLTIASKIVAIARDFIIMVLIADCTTYVVGMGTVFRKPRVLATRPCRPMSTITMVQVGFSFVAALAGDDELAAGGWRLADHFSSRHFR